MGILEGLIKPKPAQPTPLNAGEDISISQKQPVTFSSGSPSIVRATIFRINGVSDSTFNQIIANIRAYSAVPEIESPYGMAVEAFRNNVSNNTQAHIDPAIVQAFEIPLDSFGSYLSRLKDEQVQPGAIVGMELKQSPVDGVGEVLSRSVEDSHFLEQKSLPGPEFSATSSTETEVIPTSFVAQLRASTESTSPEVNIYIINKISQLPNGND